MLRAIENLKPKDREVLRLARWEGLTHAEIGAMFGTSAHAIDQRLHSITRRLASDLGRPQLTAPASRFPRRRGEGKSHDSA